jgi:hypothetical protein
MCFLRLNRLSVEIATNIKSTLRNLRQTRQKVASDVVERIVSSIDAFQEACCLLHPNVFVAIIRILIHAETSHFRDRGLYLLAVSGASECARTVHADCVESFLHNENQKQEAKDEIQRALSGVGKDCLELIFVSFCDKGETYKTRRWVI